jgi:hypothetical protein
MNHQANQLITKLLSPISAFNPSVTPNLLKALEAVTNRLGVEDTKLLWRGKQIIYDNLKPDN